MKPESIESLSGEIEAMTDLAQQMLDQLATMQAVLHEARAELRT